ncbi:hypothetical protein GP486_003572 [Trichoglossum hirsutum]|uniref:Transcription factor domain-containing protein n=1 Tax=Trichoglossum hirsutum TaxID=265104 RepID=A0A9P8LCT4_9PEZI|nr:hypothetical protein GP486_003572 [Trichoglossum hirsutum]
MYETDRLNCTRKDKTLMEILDRLRRLEGKIDILGEPSAQCTSPEVAPKSQAWSDAFQPLRNVPPGQGILSSQLAVSPLGTRVKSTESVSSVPSRRITAAHKLLLWPAIREILDNAGIDTAKDLGPLQRDGTQWLVRILQRESNRAGLPSDANLESRPFVGMQTTRTGPRVVFPELSAEHMQNVSSVYFNTFNFLYPLLDRELFYAQALHKVTTEGFGEGDTESVIALLVLALGQCALDGSVGEPIAGDPGEHSGIRGGTKERPPGLSLFNEARRRMGYLMTQCELENVQIFSLAADEDIDWSTRRGDHIKRAYWHCVLMENGLTLELDLPGTGICEYEDVIPPPDFDGPYSFQDMMESERSHYKYHFLAQMALKKLYSRIQSTMYDSSVNGSEKADDYDGPPVSVIRELARQLDSWRELLPTPLQWSDDKTYEMPQSSTHQAQSTTSALFVPDDYSMSVTNGYSLDILVAVLRTRFYLLKYIIYRPFIYKALHYPDRMTAEDINNCKICLKACLHWPLCMYPPKDKKRLLPQLFSWTQNILGILLIFHMTNQSESLRYIRDTHFEPGELEESASLMLDWIHDMKKVDSNAAWCCGILERLYPS